MPQFILGNTIIDNTPKVNLSEYMNLSQQYVNLQGENTIKTFGIVVLIGIILIGLFYLWYRDHFAYKIGIFRHGSLKFKYKFNLGDSINIHDKEYEVKNENIYGQVLLFRYGDSAGLKFVDDIKIEKQDMTQFKKSTVIEKFATAFDFIGEFGRNQKIAIAILIIIAFACWMIYNHDPQCHVIFENQTIQQLQEVFKVKV